MGKVRVVFKKNKSVAVIHLAPKSRLSEEQVFNKAMTGDLKGLPFKDIDSSELPQLREYRDAWEGDDVKGVKVNPEKAIKLKETRERVELIAKEKEKILETQAVANLKAEGKIK